MNSQNLTVEYISISVLNAAKYNPRKHSKEQMEQLKESIKRFGLVDPIIVNRAKERQNIIIGGHFRMMAALELGITTVPVVYVDIPELDREKELNLRLNKNQGEFDFELLRDFDKTLLEYTGFSKIEMSAIFVDLNTEDDYFDVAKELSEIKTPTSKVGDLYELGPHRLICGDSTDLNVVKRLVGANKVSMTYNDPIYNIGLSYRSGIGGSKNYGGTVTDNKTDAAYEAFVKKTMINALAVSDDNSHVFYYCDQSYTSLIMGLYAELGINYKRTCIWLKGLANPTPQIAFSKVYEPCVYGTTGRPYLSPHYKNFDEVLNKEIHSGNQMIDDVTELFDVWLVKRLNGLNYNHPTEKPVTLHDKPIKRCTRVGDIVLSLFGGSGGDLIACHQLKRSSYMSEVDPIFVDLIIRRYEKLTGEKAIKLEE